MYTLMVHWSEGLLVRKVQTAFTGAHDHVFKVGVQFLGLGYCTEQNADGIPSFVHCSLQLHKKLGWSVQFFFLGGVGPPRPPSGCMRP